MFRYPDETYRTDPPAKVDYQGFRRNFFDLTREQWDEIGYNEAVPLKREPFTTYETRWEKGDDLIDRELPVSAVENAEAKAENKAAAVRIERDRLIAASDWTQLADCPLTEDEIAAWSTYRQELRDVPQQEGFPNSMEWPTPA